MKVVKSYRIDEDYYKFIEEQAKKEHRTVSNLVEKVLINYIYPEIEKKERKQFEKAKKVMQEQLHLDDEAMARWLDDMTITECCLDYKGRSVPVLMAMVEDRTVYCICDGDKIITLDSNDNYIDEVKEEIEELEKANFISE